MRASPKCCEFCNRPATVVTLDFDLCDIHAQSIRDSYARRKDKGYEDPADEFMRRAIKEEQNDSD